MSDFKAKMHPKSILAGAPPQTTLGELTAVAAWCRVNGIGRINEITLGPYVGPG